MKARKEEEARRREAELLNARKAYFEERKQAAARQQQLYQPSPNNHAVTTHRCASSTSGAPPPACGCTRAVHRQFAIAAHVTRLLRAWHLVRVTLFPCLSLLRMRMLCLSHCAVCPIAGLQTHHGHQPGRPHGQPGRRLRRRRPTEPGQLRP